MERPRGSRMFIDIITFPYDLIIPTLPWETSLSKDTRKTCHTHLMEAMERSILKVHRSEMYPCKAYN